MCLGAGSAGLLTHRVVHTYIYIDTSCIRLISEASSWCRGTPAFKEMFAFVFNLKHWFLLVCLSEEEQLPNFRFSFYKDWFTYTFIYFFLIGFLSHQLLLLLGKQELLLRHLGNICKLELQKKKNL